METSSPTFASTISRFFPEGLVCRIISDLKNAMQELRLNDLIHRDIKPQNILLTSKDLATTSFKLADFGFAKQFAFEELQKHYVDHHFTYNGTRSVRTRKIWTQD